MFAGCHGHRDIGKEDVVDSLSVLTFHPCISSVRFQPCLSGGYPYIPEMSTLRATGIGVHSVAFWDWLEPQRKKRGWSQGRLERELGLSKGHVSKWKKGAGASRRTCIALAELWEIPVDEVLQAAGHDPGGTQVPLTSGQAGLQDIHERLSTIEKEVTTIRSGLGKAGLIDVDPDVVEVLIRDVLIVQVAGRIPADSLRWTLDGDEYEVEVPRIQVGDARDLVGFQVTGDCFQSIHILSGDVVICERANGRVPNDRQLAVIRIGDDVTLKRWCKAGERIELRDGDEDVIHTISPSDDVEVIALYVTYLPLAPR